MLIIDALCQPTCAGFVLGSNGTPNKTFERHTTVTKQRLEIIFVLNIDQERRMQARAIDLLSPIMPKNLPTI